MIIRLPCKLGEMDGRHKYPLSHVSWFQWVLFGCQYTYVYKDDSIYPKTEIDTINEDKTLSYPIKYEVSSDRLCENILNEIGFPLKGNGYIAGICIYNGQLMADVLYTSQYNAHVYVSVDDKINFIDTLIVVPPTWSKEKIQKLLDKNYKNIKIGHM